MDMRYSLTGLLVRGNRLFSDEKKASNKWGRDDLLPLVLEVSFWFVFDLGL